MIISTRGRYGLRAMFELAKAWGRGPVSLRQISEAQGLPGPYLEQIFPAEKSGAGDRAARRGGGYELTLPPERISVGHVLVALEGELTPAECAGSSAACEERRQLQRARHMAAHLRRHQRRDPRHLAGRYGGRRAGA